MSGTGQFGQLGLSLRSFDLNWLSFVVSLRNTTACTVMIHTESHSLCESQTVTPSSCVSSLHTSSVKPHAPSGLSMKSFCQWSVWISSSLCCCTEGHVSSSYGFVALSCVASLFCDVHGTLFSTSSGLCGTPSSSLEQ